jgi:hypothetical protein
LPESRHRRNRRPRNLEIPRTTRRTGTNKLLLIASIIIAVLVIAGFSIPTIIDSISGPSDFTLGTAEAHVDGVGVKQEIMRSKLHVDLNSDGSDDDVAYSTVPPTSGDHWSTPNRCGFYTDPVADEVIVHNLEHSNIVVSYNLPNQADVDALKNLYNDLDDGWRNHFTVMRPYDEVGPGKVALSAWGVLDIMDGVDGDRIERFYEHYVGRLGPEGAISCRGSQNSMPGAG